jgi:hypothetical protein
MIGGIAGPSESLIDLLRIVGVTPASGYSVEQTDECATYRTTHSATKYLRPTVQKIVPIRFNGQGPLA